MDDRGEVPHVVAEAGDGRQSLARRQARRRIRIRVDGSVPWTPWRAPGRAGCQARFEHVLSVGHPTVAPSRNSWTGRKSSAGPRASAMARASIDSRGRCSRWQWPPRARFAVGAVPSPRCSSLRRCASMRFKTRAGRANVGLVTTAFSQGRRAPRRRRTDLPDGAKGDSVMFLRAARKRDSPRARIGGLRFDTPSLSAASGAEASAASRPAWRQVVLSVLTSNAICCALASVCSCNGERPSASP